MLRVKLMLPCLFKLARQSLPLEARSTLQLPGAGAAFVRPHAKSHCSCKGNMFMDSGLGFNGLTLKLTET